MEHLVFSNYIGYKSSKIANFVQVELRPKQEYGVFTFYARLTFASMGKSSLPALDIKGRERAESRELHSHLSSLSQCRSMASDLNPQPREDHLHASLVSPCRLARISSHHLGD